MISLCPRELPLGLQSCNLAPRSSGEFPALLLQVLSEEAGLIFNAACGDCKYKFPPVENG